MTQRANWIKRILDRRAAKGGKLVLWWRRTFGELSPDELETMAKLAEDVAKKAAKRR